ncbi:hypothetical protein NYA22BAC_01179 [Parasphingorhabdus sp. NYA22]
MRKTSAHTPSKLTTPKKRNYEKPRLILLDVDTDTEGKTTFQTEISVFGPS